MTTSKILVLLLFLLTYAAPPSLLEASEVDPKASVLQNNRMSTDSVEKIIKTQLDAYNRRNIEDFVKTYSANAQLINFSDMKPMATGAKELRTVYEKLFSENPRLHCEIKNRKVIGSRVIDVEKVTGFANRGDLDAVAIYEVTDNLISKVWLIKP